jgi:oligogalacturonide lyase
MGKPWTRRGFVASLALAAARGAPAAKMFPSERARYLDAATEFPVLRLTSPEHSSFLTSPYQRSVSRRRSFLVYSSDRTGSLQLFQMSLASGESRLLTEASALDPTSVTLTTDDRSVFFFDGPTLWQLTLGTGRSREVYRVRDGFDRVPGFHLARNNANAALVEAQGDSWQLRLLSLVGREVRATTVIEAGAPIREPLIRPQHEDILYREGPAGTPALTSFDGRSRRSLKVAPGRVGPEYWASEGESVLYLNLPEAGRLNAIRECASDTGVDRLIASTSQFVAFSPNGDASVFVGASASKASPYVLLLLRMTRRELTLCEHRAADPTRCVPIFSPDSQRVYFESDRHGKPALYCVMVDRLVERTEP